MSNVIPFPGGADRMMREVERAVSSLNISNPALRECITKRVSAVLAKNPGIPTLGVNVTLPPGVTEEDIKPLISALQNEYQEKTMELARGLIMQICLLEVRLCKCEHGLA